MRSLMILRLTLSCTRSLLFVAISWADNNLNNHSIFSLIFLIQFLLLRLHFSRRDYKLSVVIHAIRHYINFNYMRAAERTTEGHTGKLTSRKVFWSGRRILRCGLFTRIVQTRPTVVSAFIYSVIHYHCYHLYKWQNLVYSMELNYMHYYYFIVDGVADAIKLHAESYTPPYCVC